jgi:hypothetical protein
MGLTTLACGGALLCWSLIARRPDLWTIGAPTTLIGCVAILIGLILQIDTLGQENRDTAARIDHVNRRIAELKNRSAGISGRSSLDRLDGRMDDAAQTQQLLADLKRQLELLASRIEQQAR